MRDHTEKGVSRRQVLSTGAFIAVATALPSVGLTTFARAQEVLPIAAIGTLSSDDLAQRTIQRRAIEAAIWGMPVISFDAMRQAYFRDAKAKYGDIMYWSKPGNWKLQCLTPNTSVRYVFSFINTSQGPVVLEIPATGDAALNGTLIDAWQIPVADVGIVGADEARAANTCCYPLTTPATFRLATSPSSCRRSTHSLASG